MDGSGLLNFPEFLAMMGYKVGVYICQVSIPQSKIFFKLFLCNFSSSKLRLMLKMQKMKLEKLSKFLMG